jgi:hypothetical protein
MAQSRMPSIDPATHDSRRLAPQFHRHLPRVHPPLIAEGVASMILGRLLWRYVASAEMGQVSAQAALMASIMLRGGLARKLIWPRFWV